MTVYIETPIEHLRKGDKIKIEKTYPDLDATWIGRVAGVHSLDDSIELTTGGTPRSIRIAVGETRDVKVKIFKSIELPTKVGAIVLAYSPEYLKECPVYRRNGSQWERVGGGVTVGENVVARNYVRTLWDGE